MPLVSVIMPTHGRPNFLKQSIESVLSQTYSNFELIVVDDNSNEQLHIHTKEIIDQYLPNKNIKYFHDGINRGGALARNKGIELSSGEYITFLDDDDQYCPEKIETQLNHLQSNNLDVSVCDMFFLTNGKLKDVSNCYARVNTASEFILNGNSYTPMIMATKQVILDIDSFTDTPRYQDHVLMLKFFIKQKNIGHIAKQLFIHNNHTGTRITNTNKFEIAYEIRNSFEQQLLSKLSKLEYKKYQFNDLLIRSKILRYKNKNYQAYLNIVKSTTKISNPSDLLKILKTLVRITFFKKMPI